MSSIVYTCAPIAALRCLMPVTVLRYLPLDFNSTCQPRRQDPKSVSSAVAVGLAVAVAVAVAVAEAVAVAVAVARCALRSTFTYRICGRASRMGTAHRAPRAHRHTSYIRPHDAIMWCGWPSAITSISHQPLYTDADGPNKLGARLRPRKKGGARGD